MIEIVSSNPGIECFTFVVKLFEGTKIKLRKPILQKILENSGLCRVHQNIDAIKMRSGCGSVGRAVASDTRGPRFVSSHRHKFIYIEHLFSVNSVIKRRK